MSAACICCIYAQAIAEALAGCPSCSHRQALGAYCGCSCTCQCRTVLLSALPYPLGASSKGAVTFWTHKAACISLYSNDTHIYPPSSAHIAGKFRDTYMPAEGESSRSTPLGLHVLSVFRRDQTYNCYKEANLHATSRWKTAGKLCSQANCQPQISLIVVSDPGVEARDADGVSLTGSLTGCS